MPWMLQHPPSLALRAQAHRHAGHDGAMARWQDGAAGGAHARGGSHC